MSPDIDFESIYNAYFPKIHSYLVKLIGAYHAEDAAQEVFDKAGKNFAELRDPSKISTWLYRIATNTAIDKTRSPSYRQTDEIKEQDEQGTGSHTAWPGKKEMAVDQRLIKEEMRSCVQEFIGRLPEAYKTVLVLKDYENKTDKEVSQIMGITVSTAKIRYHRAKNMLKKELDSGCEFFYDDENRLQCDRKHPSGIIGKLPE